MCCVIFQSSVIAADVLPRTDHPQYVYSSLGYMSIRNYTFHSTSCNPRNDNNEYLINHLLTSHKHSMPIDKGNMNPINHDIVPSVGVSKRVLPHPHIHSSIHFTLFLIRRIVSLVSSSLIGFRFQLNLIIVLIPSLQCDKLLNGM